MLPILFCVISLRGCSYHYDILPFDLVEELSIKFEIGDKNG